ncbi:MAG: ArsR/SmtB family transcription factor [Parvibaculaceae bacterium]
MVENLDHVFHALSDPTRRAMLAALSEHERNIGELAQPFAMSFAAASKHVKVLERAGLVSRKIAGRTHICRLEPQSLMAAEQWIRRYERFWTLSLDALEAALLAEDKPSKPQQER